MKFFDMRFDGFRKVERRCSRTFARGACASIPTVKLARTVSDNILARIAYVHEYFSGKFPRESDAEKEEKYRDMGQTFTKIYKEKR